jgi:polar amino acid transport system substrate-binding protein
MHRFIFQIVVIFPLFLLAQATEKPLRVGYSGSEPFIIGQDKPEGIAIDVWREITYTMNLDNYEFQPYPTIENGINAVKNGEIDLLIGPVTITAERATQVSFSQPYFDTGFAILAPALEMNIWERLGPFFSTNFLYAVIILLFILSLVGVLVWLAERKTSPEAFGSHPLKGIGTGIWLALVTMTTVGYGDFAPKTILGRFIIGTWMIVSLIMATSFVAGIASTLTLTGSQEKTITAINQLSDKKVAIPPNDKLVESITNVGGEPIIVNSVEAGYDLLMSGTVAAFLYDKVQLEYIFSAGKKNDYILTKNNTFTQHYGFAFAPGSMVQNSIDVTILQLKEAGAINRIVASWLAPSSDN